MTDRGCPNCGAPYLRTVSADEHLTGELRFPDGSYEQVCYKSRVQPEAYFGFTLYLHPATVYAVEVRHGPDEEWSLAAARDTYASEATAEDRRSKLERIEDDPNLEVRIREMPLRAAQNRG